MRKWNCKVVEFTNIGVDSQYYRDQTLSDLTEEGWRLVSTVLGQFSIIAFFEREVVAS